MTNLQQNAPVLSPQTLQRIWFGVPAAALGLLSLVFAVAVLSPMWQSLQRDLARVQQLQDLVMQVSLMRQQLRAQDIQEEKALQQKDKLFRMIAGSGDVSTVLAVLDREAQLSGVQLDLYEPQGGAPAPAAAAPAAGNRPPQGQPQPPSPNPLETAGLQPQTMLISVRGAYPKLLAFLRRVEALNVLVIQNDLKLEAPQGAEKAKVGAENVTMKLSLTLYGSPPGAETPAPAPAAPVPGAAAQPQGAAAAPAPAPAGQPAAGR